MAYYRAKISFIRIILKCIYKEMEFEDTDRIHSVKNRVRSVGASYDLDTKQLGLVTELVFITWATTYFSRRLLSHGICYNCKQTPPPPPQEKETCYGTFIDVCAWGGGGSVCLCTPGLTEALCME